jgi:hypothetical protein
LVSIDGNLEGRVVADAFRFVYRSTEFIVISSTPLPTPVAWTHHPASPLEQLTSGDLTTRLGLVQPFYTYTPIISAETITFEDCQAFPRDGWRAQVQYQDMVVTYPVSQDYRFAVLTSVDTLAGSQLVHLMGGQGNRYLPVDRYPDDTWHVCGEDYDGTYGSHLQLDDEAVERLTSSVQLHDSVSFETPDGLTLRLLGLGERVDVSEGDQAQLATSGAELAASVW